MPETTDPFVRAVVAAHRAGDGIDAIAARTGATPMLVRTVLGRAGVLPARRGRPYPYDAGTEAAIAAEYAAGVTMATLRSRYGGTNRVIRYVLEHRGIPVRPRGTRR